MDLDPSVVWDFAGTLVGTLRERPRQLPATVSRVDPDGTVWLSMPGADGLVPASTTADVSADDAVTVEWWGNAYHVTGNGTSPSIGTRAGAALRRATAAAAKVAGEAKGIANAVGQHFWADDNGVHVSNEDGNAVGERNILMNSLGILLRQGSAWLASFSDSAVAFYDGLGNEAANVVAQFGADGATIGRESESHIWLDYHSMRLLHPNIEDLEEAYFQVSDLRDRDGNIVEEFNVTTLTPSFTVSYPIAEVVSVAIDGTETTAYTVSGNTVTLDELPSSLSLIAITYSTSRYDLQTFTFGSRESNSRVGAMSFSEGELNVASGDTSHAEGVNAEASGNYSHAEGYGSVASGNTSHAEGYGSVASGSNSHAQNNHTVAAFNNQTAIGKYNDNDPDNAFEVGNGTADDARSNAFAVDWDGNVEAAGLYSATCKTSTVALDTTKVSADSPNAVWSNGVCCTVSLSFKMKTSWAPSGTAVTIGTVPDGYRPRELVYISLYVNAGSGGSGGVIGYIGSNGTIYVVNRSTLTFSANQAYRFTATYAV